MMMSPLRCTQRTPVPSGAGDLPQPASRRGEIEVNERDGLTIAEDDVLRARVVVAHHIAARRIGPRHEPTVYPAVVKRCRGVVEPTKQTGNAHQRGIGHRPWRKRRQRNLTVDIREHLSAFVVDAAKAGSALEADFLEMKEQLANRR